MNICQLVATQGALSAIGSSLLYGPTTLNLDEWFIQWKGLAYGIMLASKSLAGAVLPFIMNALLAKYGFRIVIRPLATASVRPAKALLPSLPWDTADTAYRVACCQEC